MGGIAYLILCFMTGFSVIELIFKDFGTITESTFGGKKISLNSMFLKLPAYFVTGVLINTWLVYLTAYLFRGASSPLIIANSVVMTAATVFSVFSFWFIFFKRKKKVFSLKKNEITISEMVMITLITLLVFFIMFKSLGMVDGKLKVGLSVFSDFSTHLSMMRSFSHMDNIPTHYTMFGGTDVKYHFMFQFLCGNLEFLGLRLDQALNLPSILSMIFSYFLLYVLAIKFCGKRSIGFISLVLYTFRSSASLFEYILTLPEGQVLSTLFDKNNFEFIGSTNHEDWGLWNLNVYCNQRHFSFSLTIMLLVLILMLPNLYKAKERISEQFKDRKFDLYLWYKYRFFSKEGWLIKDCRTCIFLGFILGLSGFFNGAVVIGVLIILFFIAAAADNRLEFVILAGIAGILSFLQTKVFISSSLFTPELYFGFLSDKKNIFGVADYLRKMMGILPIVLLIQFTCVKKVHKYIMFCFCTPIIFAFTVSLTPDIAVNHKYVMIGIMLLDIYASAFLVRLFERKDVVLKCLGAFCTMCLTFTGIFEFIILSRKNIDERSIQYEYEDDIMEWIWNNADSDDIFLTANYYMMYDGRGNSVILSGAQMYNGWEYFSWSAGYDVGIRDEYEILIYSAESQGQLYHLCEEAGIDYIVIDRNNRYSDMYELNESLIDNSFEKVFSCGSGEEMFSIYDVNKRIMPVG